MHQSMTQGIGMVTHAVSAIAAAAVIYWRMQHPNDEHTIERRLFFVALGLQVFWNVVAMMLRTR